MTQLDGEMPTVNIVGKKVALGPRHRGLMPLYYRWINDFTMTRNLLTGLHPMQREAEEEWFEQSSRDEHAVHFAIYEKAAMRPIGNTTLLNIDLANRVAEFGILIGEKDCWGKGYGTEVTILMLDYAFTGLGLHNVMLRTYSFNERAIRAYTRAGFRLIGRRRESYRLAGSVYDVLYMDCLATEFQSPVLKQLLT